MNIKNFQVWSDNASMAMNKLADADGRIVIADIKDPELKAVAKKAVTSNVSTSCGSSPANGKMVSLEAMREMLHTIGREYATADVNYDGTIGKNAVSERNKLSAHATALVDLLGAQPTHAAAVAKAEALILSYQKVADANGNVAFKAIQDPAERALAKAFAKPLVSTSCGGGATDKAISLETLRTAIFAAVTSIRKSDVDGNGRVNVAQVDEAKSLSPLALRILRRAQDET